ncbi:MAG: hypothetical protein ABR947_06160 [Solirubrobacteraceae bacterium]
MSAESEYAGSTNGSAATEQPGGGAAASFLPAGGLGLVRERPEVLVGAAFAGGLIAALLLRRLGN